MIEKSSDRRAKVAALFILMFGLHAAKHPLPPLTLGEGVMLCLFALLMWWLLGPTREEAAHEKAAGEIVPVPLDGPHRR
jgi:hypothetical protein